MSLYSAKVHMLQDGDILEIDHGGSIKEPVTAETTSVNMKNFGISTINTSSDKKTFTLDRPVAGVIKTIMRPATGSTSPCVYSGGTDIEFTSSAGSDYMTFSSGTVDLSQVVQMVGLSSTRWGIIVKPTKLVIEDSASGT